MGCYAKALQIGYKKNAHDPKWVKPEGTGFFRVIFYQEE